MTPTDPAPSEVAKDIAEAVSSQGCFAWVVAAAGLTALESRLAEVIEERNALETCRAALATDLLGQCDKLAAATMTLEENRNLLAETNTKLATAEAGWKVAEGERQAAINGAQSYHSTCTRLETGLATAEAARDAALGRLREIADYCRGSSDERAQHIYRLATDDGGK